MLFSFSRRGFSAISTAKKAIIFTPAQSAEMALHVPIHTPVWPDINTNIFPITHSLVLNNTGSARHLIRGAADLKNAAQYFNLRSAPHYDSIQNTSKEFGTRMLSATKNLGASFELSRKGNDGDKLLSLAVIGLARRYVETLIKGHEQQLLSVSRFPEEIGKTLSLIKKQFLLHPDFHALKMTDTYSEPEQIFQNIMCNFLPGTIPSCESLFKVFDKNTALGQGMGLATHLGLSALHSAKSDLTDNNIDSIVQLLKEYQLAAPEAEQQSLSLVLTAIHSNRQKVLEKDSNAFNKPYLKAPTIS